MLELVGPLSVYRDWVGGKFNLQLLSQCGSTYTWLGRSVPEVHQSVAGTLSNQHTTTTILPVVRGLYQVRRVYCALPVLLMEREVSVCPVYGLGQVRSVSVPCLCSDPEKSVGVPLCHPDQARRAIVPSLSNDPVKSADVPLCRPDHMRSVSVPCLCNDPMKTVPSLSSY